MAAVMMCPAHGPVDGDTCIPGCMEPLQPNITTPTLCPAPGCEMTLPCPLHPTDPATGSDTSDAGHRELAAYLADPLPPQHHHRIVGAAALEFPWGVVDVPDGGLIIGRDHGAQCGPQIDTFDNVSREHARITLDNGQLLIDDLHSTNGTTVNGTPVTPDQRHLLADNDIVGFGSRLRATVSTTGTPA